MEAWFGFLAVGLWAGYSVSALASSSGNMALMIVTSPRVSGRMIGACECRVPKGIEHVVGARCVRDYQSLLLALHVRGT